jgi:hypothetical protein
MANPQPTVNYVAQQNILYMMDPTQNGVVQPVVALNGFQGLGGQKSSIKLSNFDSAGYEEYAPGLVDPGKPTGTVILNYGDASHQLCQKLLGLGNSGNTSFFFGQSDASTAPTAPGNVLTPATLLLAAVTQLAGSTSTSGGTLPTASTYKYYVTAITSAGETTISNEITIGPTGAGSTNSNTVNWTQLQYATGYNVYRTAAGGGTGTELKITPTPLGLVGTYIDTGANAPSGALPGANTAKYFARSGWLFNGFVAEFGYQTQVNNVAMCKLTIQATGARQMIVLGLGTAI